MANLNDSIHVAVIGVGHMGRHHVRTYMALDHVELVAVVDADADRAALVADECGCDHFSDVHQLLEHYPQLHAASVAVPTALHKAAAAPLLCRRVACLIEKPLAASVADAKALAALAAEHGVTLQVGHTERFNPGVRAIASMDITPRFVEVQRVSPMQFRSLDVGVVMDMMIHDLDIALMLVKSPLDRVDAAGIAVLGEHEDVVNARLVFADGCVANLTSSRLALKTERKLRVFSEDAYISLDYQKRNGLVIRKSGNADALRQVRTQLAAGADLSDLDYSQLIHVDELRMDLPEGEHDPLTAQLASFVGAVRDGRPPEVDANAGHAAVNVAQQVIQSVHAHNWEGFAEPRV